MRNGAVSHPSRGRGTGFAGPQAQRPPRGAGSDTKCASVGAISLSVIRVIDRDAPRAVKLLD